MLYARALIRARIYFPLLLIENLKTDMDPPLLSEVGPISSFHMKVRTVINARNNSITSHIYGS